jgi:ABC-type Fe3+ transport system permease subunit
MSTIKTHLSLNTTHISRAAGLLYRVTVLTVFVARPAHALGPVDPIVNVLYGVATVVVQFVVAGSLAMAAIGIARGAISAQWANNIGNAAGLSHAWSTILMTIILATLAALLPVIIGMVAAIIRPYVTLDFTLPRWNTP